MQWRGISADPNLDVAMSFAMSQPQSPAEWSFFGVEQDTACNHSGFTRKFVSSTGTNLLQTEHPAGFEM